MSEDDDGDEYITRIKILLDQMKASGWKLPTDMKPYIPLAGLPLRISTDRNSICLRFKWTFRSLWSVGSSRMVN